MEKLAEFPQNLFNLQLRLLGRVKRAIGEEVMEIKNLKMGVGKNIKLSATIYEYTPTSLREAAKWSDH